MENTTNPMVDREATKALEKGPLPNGIGVRVYKRRKQDGTMITDIKAADAVDSGPVFTQETAEDCWMYMCYLAENHIDALTGKKEACTPYAFLPAPKAGTVGKPKATILVGKQAREDRRPKGWHPLNNIYMYYGVYAEKGSKVAQGTELDDVKSFEDFKKSFKAAK